MSDHVQKTLDMVVAQVQDLERQAIDKKRTANDLCRLLGVDLMFEDTTSAASGITTLPDEYYGQPMPDVIRKILTKRKQSNRGAATVSEIYDAMEAGGFHFKAQNAEYAKRGIYGVLGSGTEFHKLPGGAYGLSEWYPAARTRSDSEQAPRGRPPKSVAKQTVEEPTQNGKPHVSKKQTRDEDEDQESGNDNKSFERGGLFKLVREIVMAKSNGFTMLDIFNEVNNRRGEGAAKKGSIKGLLARFVDEEMIEVVEEGAGRRPGIYRRKGQ